MELTRGEWIVLAVLILNAVVSLCCLIGNKIIGTKQYWVIFWVMLLCPVSGMMFYFLSWLFGKVVSNMRVDLRDVAFGKERVKTQLKADEDRERNILPVEEVVLMSGSKDQRLAMMNALKGDINESLSAISLALHSEDTETAHYAASALSSVLNDYRITVSKRLEKLKEEAPEETSVEEELLDDMGKILSQRVFSDLEQDRFAHIMESAAETLYQKNASRLTLERYENICTCLLEVRDTALAQKWCDRLSEQYPGELPSYTCRLRLYYTLQQREPFFRTMDELKKSNIAINNETLEIIRIFSHGRAS